MEIHPYYYSLEKRLFDVVLAIFVLIILFPILLMITLLIMIGMGWPVFYLQKRVGKDKKVFEIIKFRTMYVGAQKNQWRYRQHNQAPEPMYKNWDDPRFVGIGKWLAKTGLDELPQLINILKGEMSFIGPRPLPIQEVGKLDKTWNFRYLVRQGVFSEWSTSLKKYLTLEDWKKLEEKTLRRGGLGYEVKTIVATFKTLLLKI
ncbi:sugar transferase [Patescibacteria group bacterium]|nr:sugar transferase [Patescibacteria group bacterium]